MERYIEIYISIYFNMRILEYLSLSGSMLWRDIFDGAIYCTTSDSDFFPLNSFSASIAAESKPGSKIGKVRLKWLGHTEAKCGL